MKKVIGVMLIGLLSACLLTACGGDGGEIAGTFKGVKDNATWVMTYDKSLDDYNQNIIRFSEKTGEKISSTLNSHIKREGDWIGDDSEKYFIKVIDKNTLQFRDDEDDIYKRVE
ncbi:hypothetical protein [Arsenophonus sp.]|uniref:hypothetical protein n=1 Tax=Arsenophonus sp. TaxID=1872640 RepID=UPI0028550DE3|nr:hypothetical protein [Arsenophonus sp.]MDR5615046.1 hypothetical protein [Arsenophonus sp.]